LAAVAAAIPFVAGVGCIGSVSGALEHALGRRHSAILCIGLGVGAVELSIRVEKLLRTRHAGGDRVVD
jgi:hypothetical protein